MKQIYLFLFLSLFFFSCDSSSEKEEIKNETLTNSIEDKTLTELLSEKKAAFNEKASEEKKNLYAKGIEDVATSGTLETALKVGDQAPGFTLTNAIGEEVSLQSYLEKGPVILTWYRGGWCPYCNLTLAKLQQELPNFHKMQANVLALTPELPDSSISTKDKHNLEFEVMTDLNNKVAKEYGIVFKLIPEVASIYQNNFGLHQYNGDESDELPLAATYIINRHGEIVYAFVDKDYRNRAEPEEITQVLQELFYDK